MLLCVTLWQIDSSELTLTGTNIKNINVLFSNGSFIIRNFIVNQNRKNIFLLEIHAHKKCAVGDKLCQIIIVTICYNNITIINLIPRTLWIPISVKSHSHPPRQIDDVITSDAQQLWKRRKNTLLPPTPNKNIND